MRNACRVIIVLLILLSSVIIGAAQEEDAMLDPSLRKTVTIDADDAFLPSILTILAESSGYNIVTGPNVNKKERISIHLKDVPIDEAINLVVRAAGLSYEKIGNSFLVAETANLKEEVGLTAHVIELRYLDATEASELLSFFNANIKVDKSGNNLMIITSPKVISEIKQVIKVVDVPSLQIMLEARLVEVAVEDKEEFGINWEQLSSITSILAEQGIVGKMEGEIGSAGSYAGSGYVAVQGREFGEYPDEVPFMKMDSWNDFGQFSRQLQVLNITIDWLLKNNRAEVLANTRLATMNNRTAHLEVVDVFPYIMQTGGIGGTVTVQREEVGVKLDITPNVNSDGQITTTITPEVSSIFQLVGPPNQQVPWVVRRKSTTTIRVKDGESILIAGLLGVTASNTQHKVPFLGDIPYIGSLFRHTDNTVKKTDLIIQITPHILTDDFSGWSKPETIKASEERYLKELDEWQP